MHPYSTSLFLLLCLLPFSLCTKTQISSLETSKLGRTLLDTIQIHLSSKEPIQTIINMLNDMADTLQSDQTESDTKHSDFQEKCQSDLDYYNNEITESKSQIDSSTADLTNLNPQLINSQELLQSTQSNLESLQQQLTTATSQRQTESDEYNIKLQEHENTITALHEAQTIFQQLIKNSDSSFLQKRSPAFIQAHSSLKKAIPSIRYGYQGVFRLLAQIVEKSKEVDQEIVQKILDLIKKINENVETSGQMEKNAEEQRLAAFEELKSILQENISHAQSDISTLSNKIESLKIAIQANQEDIDTQKERLEQRQEELTDRSGECDNESLSYVTDKEKR